MTHPDSPWTRLGYGEADAKAAIARIDSGMKPLPQTIKATRVESMDMFVNTLVTGGATHLAGLSKDAIMGMSQAELSRTSTGLVRCNKGYTSVACNESGIKMPSKGEVVVEYTIMKGTQAIVTNNRAEMETLVGRGYDQTVTDTRIGNATFRDPNTGRPVTRRCLITNVTIMPNSQSGYWKVK